MTNADAVGLKLAVKSASSERRKAARWKRRFPFLKFRLVYVQLIRHLHNQLHDVPVAAVQRALRRRSVLGFEFWPHGVDDEPGC